MGEFQTRCTPTRNDCIRLLYEDRFAAAFFDQAVVILQQVVDRSHEGGDVLEAEHR